MRLILSSLLFIAAVPALAQQRSDGWSIGGFATVGQSIYVGKDISARILPGISYTSGDWSFGLNGITNTLSKTDTSTVELMLKPRIFGLITSDAPELDGIDRNLTGDVGISWSYKIAPDTTVEASILQEVTGIHNGQEARAEIEQKIMLGPVPIWLAGAITWQSDDLAGYLYGVSASEAAATRAEYNPDAALIPSASATTGYPINDKTLLFGRLTYRLLPDEITSSPIVARDDQLRLSVGLNYSF